MRICRTLACVSLLFGLMVLAGCGDVTPMTPVSVAATKGGDLIRLPSGNGYVEILAEQDKTAGKSKKAGKARVVIYVMNNDGTDAPSPAPTEATYTDGQGVAHTLSLKPDAGSKHTRFESEPTDLPVGKGVTGELSLRLGDSVEKLSLSSR
jgi:hypothetical protein